MRAARLLIFLLIIVVVGLIVALVALPRVLPLLAPPPASTPAVVTYQVYFAQQRIPQGAIITEEYLGTYVLPESSVAEVMFTVEERDTLLGKKARKDIEQGSIITSGDVVAPDQGVDVGGPIWANLIPAGKTAITIPIARLAAVGYGLSDGAHVNVIACMLMVDVDPSYQTVLPNSIGAVNVPLDGESPKQHPQTITTNPPVQGRVEIEPAFGTMGMYVIPSENQRPRPVCQMIMQDVTVLRLGNFPLSQALPAQDVNQPTPTPVPVSQPTPFPDIVTLIVDPQEAVVLTYLVYTNTPLYLTLRNSLDSTRYVTESATLQFLLSQYQITPPVKLAYALTPRIDQLTLPLLPNDAVISSPER